MLGAQRFITNTFLAVAMAFVLTATSAAIAAATTLWMRPELGIAVELQTATSRWWRWEWPPRCGDT